MTKLVQLLTGVIDQDPVQMFAREMGDSMGMTRLLRGHAERLTEFRYKPSDPGWMDRAIDGTCKVTGAMARLQASQAASLRSLLLLRTNGPKHVVIEHRRSGPTK